MDLSGNNRGGESLRLVLIAATGLLLAHIAYIYFVYPYILADDAFIALRYAQRLLQGRGLTWNDGEYVEGYSNLLWVLLNAGLGALGFGMPKAVQCLGVACTCLTPLAFLRHAREAQLSLWPFAAGVAAFAVASPVAVWALAGMETPLVMLLFAWVAVLGYTLLSEAKTAHAAAIGALLALICLLRPEGPLYTIAVALGLMVFSTLSSRLRLRIVAIICVMPLACFLSQFAFRLAYYGQWFPNTVMAKVAFTPARLVSGLTYMGNAGYFFFPLLFYVAVNIWSIRANRAEALSRRYSLFLLTAMGFLSAAIVIEGGDFFPCFRAFMPLFPLLILLLMHGVAVGLKYAPRKKELIFIAYVFACHLWLQYSVDAQQLPQSSNWMSAAKEMGLALKKKYGASQPVIAVFAAGAIPYYSELPALDVFGLNDPYLTAHRNEIGHFGSGIVGHELFSGSYIAGKKPDILIFDIPGFYPLCSGFHDECQALLPYYRPDVLHIPGEDVRIWIRKDSRKVS